MELKISIARSVLPDLWASVEAISESACDLPELLLMELKISNTLISFARFQIV